MKRAARLVLNHPFVVRAAEPITRRVAPIFMLHRFRDVEAGTTGHDPSVLRANLSWLRSNGFSLLPLSELLHRLADGAPISRAVAFTIDDGYADFAKVAAPLFAEFDCPVTVFLTTGFLDGRQWMWWDKVTTALAAVRREADALSTIESLKAIPEPERLRRIDTLIRDCGVALPVTPPPQFAPISWNDVRRLGRKGVSFGPHSVSHPILSQTGDEQSQHEVVESWRRVHEEAGDAAVPVFCFPNGKPADFSVREENAVAMSGMRAALSTRQDYTSYRDFAVDRPSARFRLPRFAYSEDRSVFIQVASGVERAKQVLRTAFMRRPS